VREALVEQLIAVATGRAPASSLPDADAVASFTAQQQQQQQQPLSPVSLLTRQLVAETFDRLLLQESEQGATGSDTPAAAAAAAVSEDVDDDDVISLSSSSSSAIFDEDHLDLGDVDESSAGGVEGVTNTKSNRISAAAGYGRLQSSRAASSSAAAAASAAVLAHALPKLEALGLLQHYNALQGLFPASALPMFKPSECQSVKAQGLPDYAVLTAGPFAAVVPYHLQQKKQAYQQQQQWMGPEGDPRMRQQQQQQQQRGTGPPGIGVGMHGPRMQQMGPPHFFPPGGQLLLQAFPASWASSPCFPASLTCACVCTCMLHLEQCYAPSLRKLSCKMLNERTHG
jgi:hypothetical protein